MMSGVLLSQNVIFNPDLFCAMNSPFQTEFWSVIKAFGVSENWFSGAAKSRMFFSLTYGMVYPIIFKNALFAYEITPDVLVTITGSFILSSAAVRVASRFLSAASCTFKDFCTFSAAFRKLMSVQ